MTKVRPFNTVEQAVKDAIDLLGIEMTADVAGRHPRTLYAWSDADDESRGIPVRSAMRIDLALISEGHAPLILPVYERAVLRDFAHAAMPVADRLLMHVRGIGEVIALYNSARDPKSPGGVIVTQVEQAQIERALAELMDCAKSLGRDFEAECGQ